MVVTNNGEKKSIPPSNAMNISIFPVPEPVYNSLMSNVTTRAIEPIFTPKMAHISSNGGVYSDRSCGVSISKTDVGAGCWAIVISTFDPTPAEYELTFFSSVELNLTALD